ncbi:MAG: hypothetical protein MR271_05220 [Fusobacterium sp.]|nr:hypothetical protein [Fusobacterium sp.]
MDSKKVFKEEKRFRLELESSNFFIILICLEFIFKVGKILNIKMVMETIISAKLNALFFIRKTPNNLN